MTLLRSALFNAWFFAATFAVGLGAFGLRWVGGQHALGAAQLWARLVLAGARRICGIEMVVLGREHLPDGAALIASEHQSAFDTLIWLRLVPRVAYVFKSELARVPLFGPLLVPAGQIPVERGGAGTALRSLMRGGAQAVADGRQVVIFPEGTRVEYGAVVKLRAGIAALSQHTGLPVIPVATDSGLRWGRRSFSKRAGPIHVALCPPIPAGMAQDDMLALLRERWREGHALIAAGDKSVHEAA